MRQIEEGIERVESVIGEMEGTVATLARLAMDESYRRVVASDLLSEVRNGREGMKRSINEERR